MRRVARGASDATKSYTSRRHVSALRGVGGILAAVACFGCGEAGTTGTTSEGGPPPPVSECLPPNRVLADRCLEPGVQDDGCPAGTLGLADGTCQPAGVPPELCAEGFEPDGAMGCEPILPDEPCPAGRMAVPGESACRPVMPCGTGQWGDIPVDADTVYVDASYPGTDSDGTAAKPWTNLSDAVAAAPADALVAVAAGSYVEDVVLEKPLRLSGVCPDEVELAGTADGYAALFFRPGSTGSEVRGLALTGDKLGIIVVGAEDILVEQVWVHDSLRHGISFEDALGPTSGTVRSSLIEQNHEVGVLLLGAAATIEDVVVRGTLPGANQLGGFGIATTASYDTGAPSTVLVRRSVVEQNHEVGVDIGSDATVEGLVVRATQPRASDQQGGQGIFIMETGAPLVALVKSSLVEQNHDAGVSIAGANATLEGVVVRTTLPRASTQSGGYGILIDIDVTTGTPATALVRSSLVEHNQYAGVAIASNATLEGVIVRDTLPQAKDQLGGAGIIMQAYPDTPPGTALVRGSLVEKNSQVGVLVAGWEATLDGVIVRATSPQVFDQTAGYGISIQHDADSGALPKAIVRNSIVEQNHEVGVSVIGSVTTLEGLVVRDNLPRTTDQAHGWGISIQVADTGAPTQAFVRNSLVENNHVFGVMVQGAHAELERLLVRNTLAQAGDGSFGDGVVVVSLVLDSGPVMAASAVVSGTRIENSARAGLGNFGAHVVLGDNELSCNLFDLNGEDFDGFAFSFEDRGQNSCGCPDSSEACVAQSSGLEPPDSLPSAP